MEQASIFRVGEPSAEDSGYYVPDILLWDPLTQFTVELSCPHCLTTGIANQLRATRWKDGKTSYDQPRKLYCIQRHVLLVSRVYRCTNGHQILANDPWLLEITETKTSREIPFVLFHKSGVTRDLFLYIFTHVQAGVKLTDIERFIAQMYNEVQVQLGVY